MKNVLKIGCLGLVAALALAGRASAGTNVSSDITTSRTWTKAASPYHLKKQIYVKNGATLTIEAGTVIASFAADQGSIAVTRGSKIKVMGSATEPVIMTSADDVATWTGSVTVGTPVTAITTMGDPKTGTWRAKCLEWGNLTIMGQGMIGGEWLASGASVRTYQDGTSAPVVTNTGTPTGLNKANMEGLTAAVAGDPNVIYGGANDDDDSGEIHYLSLRYGGKVIALLDELNGLSLGGVGRATDIDHVEIMNNVDDGIEIWGGAVNLKYISIWNVGDDYLDVDQGWRGKAQFGLIVQGYSVNASQGSGVGDNAIEADGAERNDSHPMTCTTLYNFTVIGQPDKQGPGGVTGSGGDHGIAFRDSSRIQFRQCIFMDLGEKLIQEESSETGTTAWRYGTFGTLPWSLTGVSNDVWDTAYTETWNKSNALTGGHANLSALDSAQIQALFPSQSQGNNVAANNQGFLCELTDSVFYSNANTAAYTNSNLLGPAAGTVTVSGGSSTALNNVVAASSPITTLGRAAAVNPSGSLYIANVNSLDPRAANDAQTSADKAPLDGFFTPVRYRGAFSKDVNWLLGWTSTSAYGYHAGQTNPVTPTAAESLTKVETQTTFPTVSGVVYTIEKSSDMKTWTPVAVVTGTGSDMSVADLDTFQSAMFYRAIPQ